MLLLLHLADRLDVSFLERGAAPRAPADDLA
jgi:hypothetical protein